MVTTAKMFERVKRREAHSKSFLEPYCEANRVTAEAVGQAAIKRIVRATVLEMGKNRIIAIIINGMSRCLKNILR